MPTRYISFYLRQPEDIQLAIVLLNESYQIASKQSNRKSTGPEGDIE